MLACDYSRLVVVKLLLQKGADPNLKDEDGETALSFGICVKCKAEVKAYMN